MSVVGVADQYMIFLAVTLLFTVFALVFDDEQWKKIVLQSISGVSWLVFALVHLAVGDKTSVLTSSLPYLFAFFGLVFTVVAIYNSAIALQEKRRYKY